MEMQEIINIISNVGFPIVAFGLMYKNNRDMSQTHKDEIRELTKVIDANTSVTQHLADTINYTIKKED